jgi:hypothetical protein
MGTYTSLDVYTGAPEAGDVSLHKHRLWAARTGMSARWA